MNAKALLVALAEAAAMLMVAGAYIIASRRWTRLKHPLSIILYVMLVGIAVAVLGEVYRGGWSGVPVMIVRAAIGSAGWGVIIAAIAWVVQRGLARRGR
jgi:hypothetical protein